MILGKFKKKKTEPKSPEEKKLELKRIQKEFRDIIKDTDVNFTMEQIAEMVKQNPTDFGLKDVKNPEEYKLGHLALSYSMSEDYEDCIDTCNKGLEINPDNPYLLYLRGRTFSDLGEIQKGFNDLKKAVTLRNDFADAWYEMGRIFHMDNDMDKAILAYYRANELEPNYYKISEEGSGSFPKFTQTLDEKGVKIVLDYLRSTKDIDVVLDGYFAIRGEKKLLKEYVLPPKNIRVSAYSESDEKVRSWVKGLTQKLLDAGISAQLKDDGNMLRIETQNMDSKKWETALMVYGNDFDVNKI